MTNAYCPQTKFGARLCFYMHLSFCPQRRGVHAMHIPPAMHIPLSCMPPATHAPYQACPKARMPPSHGYYQMWSMSGRYASYFCLILFVVVYLRTTRVYSTSEISSLLVICTTPFMDQEDLERTRWEMTFTLSLCVAMILVLPGFHTCILISLMSTRYPDNLSHPIFLFEGIPTGMQAWVLSGS